MSGLLTRLARGPLRLQMTNGFINQVNMVGNIGSVTVPEPSQEAPNSNKPIRISLAVEKTVSRAVAEAATDSKRPVQWFNVVVFNPRIKEFASRLTPGSKIFVTGSLQVSSSTKTPERTQVSILADEISVLYTKKIQKPQEGQEGDQQ